MKIKQYINIPRIKPLKERYFAGSEIVKSNMIERKIKRNVMIENFCQGFKDPVVFFIFSMDKFLFLYFSQSLLILLKGPETSG